MRYFIAVGVLVLVLQPLAGAAPPKPAAKGVDATCAALLVETRAVVAKAVAGGPSVADAKVVMEALEPFGRCVSGGTAKGRWALVLDGAPELESVEGLSEADYDDDDDAEAQRPQGFSVMAHATPVFITADGVRHAPKDLGAAARISDILDGSGARFFPPWPFEASEVDADASRDWSGDEVPELVVSGPGVAEVFQWDGARVKRYAPTAALPSVSAIKDFDGDGRPDLVDAGFFTYELWGDGNVAETLSLVAHGRPDGTFATDDAATRAFYAKACDGAGRSPWLLGREGEEILHNLACAHLFGVSPRVIAAAIKRERPALEGDERFEELQFDVDELPAWVSRPLPVKLARADGLVVRAPARVSASGHEADWKHYRFQPEQAVDGDLGSSWQPKKKARKPWIALHFDAPVTVTAVEIANGFQRTDALGDLFAMNQRAKRVRVTVGETSVDLALDPKQRGYQKLELPAPATGDEVRITVLEVAAGTRWKQVALSEVRALGPR